MLTPDERHEAFENLSSYMEHVSFWFDQAWVAGRITQEELEAQVRSWDRAQIILDRLQSDEEKREEGI